MFQHIFLAASPISRRFIGVNTWFVLSQSFKRLSVLIWKLAVINYTQKPLKKFYPLITFNIKKELDSDFFFEFIQLHFPKDAVELFLAD